jgi:hypothetical protein
VSIRPSCGGELGPGLAILVVFKIAPLDEVLVVSVAADECVVSNHSLESVVGVLAIEKPFPAPPLK